MNHSLLRVPILAFVLLYITGCSLIVDSAIEDMKKQSNQPSDYYVSFDFDGQHYSRVFKNNETFVLSYSFDPFFKEGNYYIGALKCRSGYGLLTQQGIRIIREGNEDIVFDFIICGSTPFDIGALSYFDNMNVRQFYFLSGLYKETSTVNGSFSIESIDVDRGVLLMKFEFDHKQYDGSVVSVRNGQLFAHVDMSDEVKNYYSTK